jgi:hypothetical protein
MASPGTFSTIFLSIVRSSDGDMKTRNDIKNTLTSDCAAMRRYRTELPKLFLNVLALQRATPKRTDVIALLLDTKKKRESKAVDIS